MLRGDCPSSSKRLSRSRETASFKLATLVVYIARAYTTGKIRKFSVEDKVLEELPRTTLNYSELLQTARNFQKLEELASDSLAMRQLLIRKAKLI